MPSSDSHNTALIYLEILRSLPKRQKITVQDICKRLESLGIVRSERTIQRILEKLCEHYDIDCDMSSKPYGYRWKSHSAGLSLPFLNEAESLLLMLAEQHLHQLLPARTLAALTPIFEQARKKLVHDAHDKPEREWLGKIAVVPTSQPLIPAPIAAAILENVSTALYQNKYLDITYQNQKNATIAARIQPLALVQQGATLYLVARFAGYDNERHLALHRLRSATPSTMGFTRPKDFNLERYQAEGRFGFGEGKKIRLSFDIERIAGYHLTQTPLSHDQTTSEYPNYYHISATVIDSEMLNWWLAKFGTQIRNITKTPLPDSA